MTKRRTPRSKRRSTSRRRSKFRRAQTRLDLATPLANIRQARTLRQDQMAWLLKVSQQTYSRYESGELPVPKDQRERIAAMLGASVDVLWPEGRPTTEQQPAKTTTRRASAA